MLLSKYQAFVNDDTMLNAVKKQGIKLLSPGFLLEFFVFDISEDMKIYDDDYYIRHTGIAKVIYASPFNADIASHADVKENDIVLLGDHMSVMKLSEEWENWFEEQKSPNAMQREEPIKYIKGFHILLSQGRLFYVHRGGSLLSGKNLRFGTDEIKQYRGPYLFFVDPQDVLYTVENPFGDVE